MKGEIYYWIAAAVIILAAALYVRYYYTPGINVSLEFSAGTPANVYVYQKAGLSLDVINGGSAIRDFDVGIMINGNLTGVYNVTLAAGKETVIQLSHTFQQPGVYNFTAVGDPARLYNLVDRSEAEDSVAINVLGPETPDPAAMLPSNATSVYSSNMSSLGYAVASYLYGNYSVEQTGLSDIPAVDAFMYPILNLTSGYIANISYAGADYPGGKAYSLWFSGYVSPKIIGVAAQSLNLSITNESFGSENLTLVSLTKNTTLCGWYDGGWVKTLAYEGNASCLSVLQKGGKGLFISDSLRNRMPQINGSVEVANFSDYTPILQRSGRLDLFAGESFIYSVLWKNITQNTVCYGIVDTANGISYCSVDLLPARGSPNNTALIRTTAYIGEYNATVFALVNASKIFDQVDTNIGVIRTFNLTGASLNFSYGIQNTCSLTKGLGCSNVSYGNGIISFELRNAMNSPVKLNSIGCFWSGIGFGTPLNRTVAPGSSANLTATCYNNGSQLTGIALNLNLNLLLNYSMNGTSHNVAGKAFIV